MHCGAEAGSVGEAEPLVELVGIEPAGGGVVAERLGHPLALGVRGEDVVRRGDERLGRHGA